MAEMTHLGGVTTVLSSKPLTNSWNNWSGRGQEVTTVFSSIFQPRPSHKEMKGHIWVVTGSDNCTLLHLTQTLQQRDETTYQGGESKWQLYSPPSFNSDPPTKRWDDISGKWQEVTTVLSSIFQLRPSNDAATYRCWSFRKRDKTWHN